MDLSLKDIIELVITFIVGFVSGGVTLSFYKNKTTTKTRVQQNKNFVLGDLTGGSKNDK